jgi:hypothetical protein
LELSHHSQAIKPRHTKIQQEDIGLEVCCQFYCLVATGCDTHAVHVGLAGEQHLQRVCEHGVIFGNQYADG